MSKLPLQDMSLKRRMATVATRDSLRATLILMMITNLLSFYHFLHAKLADPRDSMSFNASYGPFGKTDLPVELLPPSYPPTKAVFRPGETITFVSSLCVNENVTITGHAELIRTAQDGAPEALVVPRRDTLVPPSMHRCGPRVGTFEFPADTVPGIYEVRRWVDIEGQDPFLHWLWPLQVRIKPLVVRVVAAPVPVLDPSAP